jgi:uncharacterized protein (TIGR03083 family)
MTKIAAGLSAEQRAARVPACPDWTVRDLIAHVASLAHSIANGFMPGDLNLVMFWDDDIARRRENFVEEQLQTRESMSLEEILDQWTEAGEAVEAMLRGERPLPPGSPALIDWILVTDVGVHHHDLRGAVGMPGDRDSAATKLSLRSYIEAMKIRTAARGLPGLRLRPGNKEYLTGEGEPAATVGAGVFEMARAAAGRRSPDQIRAFAWEGDPEPFLELFYPYGVRTDALVE